MDFLFIILFGVIMLGCGFALGVSLGHADLVHVHDWGLDPPTDE